MNRSPIPSGSQPVPAAHRHQKVLLYVGDSQIRKQLIHELSNTLELIPCDSLEELSDSARRLPNSVGLIHLGQQTLKKLSPSFFMTELSEVTNLIPLYAIVSDDCPARLKTLADKSLDGCFKTPITYDQLKASLSNGYDFKEELDRLFYTRSHKSLEGHAHSLVTFTPELFQIIDELEIASRYDVTVLLIGETGSGKTHVAQLIHELSPRSSEPFVTVSCGAIPPNLIESELFGHVRGAFTGADHDKDGRFAAAGKGTLLLDEIDVLPLDQQTKLLRVIETNEYEPVGCNQTHTSHARVIVASNEELPSLVDAGMFRPDLYYRLNVVKFILLPLRDRPHDVEFLARKFALEYSRSHGIRLRRSDPAFIESLLSYSWPGNIRQLKNAIQRAVLYCRNGKLTSLDIPKSGHQIQHSGNEAGKNQSVRESSPQISSQTAYDVVPVRSPTQTLGEQLDLVERRIIEDTLRRNNHSRKQTAAELAISRVTLYNKMKRLGLHG